MLNKNEMAHAKMVNHAYIINLLPWPMYHIHIPSSPFVPLQLQSVSSQSMVVCVSQLAKQCAGW